MLQCKSNVNSMISQRKIDNTKKQQKNKYIMLYGIQEKNKIGR